MTSGASSTTFAPSGRKSRPRRNGHGQPEHFRKGRRHHRRQQWPGRGDGAIPRRPRRAPPQRREHCSKRSRPALRRSPTKCCSAMCGGGPSCSHATAAWCDGKAGAACRPLGPSPQQRCTAKRGLRPSSASGDLLRVAERGLGARRLRAGVHCADSRHRSTARRGRAPSSSRLRRGTGKGGDRRIDYVAVDYTRRTGKAPGKSGN
jgi:hypothetical protein